MLCPLLPVPFSASNARDFTAAHAPGGAINSPLCGRVPRGVPNALLLRRPGDGAIARAIGRSVYELIAARIEISGNCVLGGLPVIFLVQ